MPSFSTILQRVRDNVVLLPTATEDRLEEWIQQAQERAEEAFPWKAMEKSQTYVTAEDTRQLGLKTAMTRYMRRRELPYCIDGIGGTRPLAYIDTSDEIARQFSELDPTDKGRPRKIEETELGWNVWPLPDALNVSGTVYSDGDYRIVIPYLGREATLTDAAQENFFTENLSDYLEHWATWRALRHNHDNENANIALAEAQEALKRAIRLEVRKRLIGLRVVPVRDVRAPLTQRRQLR